ncbi:MAG: hypothetical protein V7723_14985 [Sneathiella sp.]|uniref:hypothetical protein n=1 Tax=Sneathiella sp. TaxID=1964365 RepID=UPI0030019F79
MLKKMALCLSVLLALSACQTIPTGPDFSDIAVPVPPQNKALIIVYRSYAEPTGVDATVYVDGEELFPLYQKSFAFAVVEPGRRNLEIKWPAITMTPGWQGEGNFEKDRTYFFQLTGTSGNGVYFKSMLRGQSEALASANLSSCCRLITDLKDSVSLANATYKTEEQANDAVGRFGNLKVGMSPEDVINAIGKPDQMNLKSTGKAYIPFFFGTDTLRSYWSYKGQGYVVFTRNEYTGSLKLVETINDPKI